MGKVLYRVVYRADHGEAEEHLRGPELEQWLERVVPGTQLANQSYLPRHSKWRIKNPARKRRRLDWQIKRSRMRRQQVETRVVTVRVPRPVASAPPMRRSSSSAATQVIESSPPLPPLSSPIPIAVASPAPSTSGAAAAVGITPSPVHSDSCSGEEDEEASRPVRMPSDFIRALLARQPPAVPIYPEVLDVRTGKSIFRMLTDPDTSPMRFTSENNTRGGCTANTDGVAELVKVMYRMSGCINQPMELKVTGPLPPMPLWHKLMAHKPPHQDQPLGVYTLHRKAACHCGIIQHIFLHIWPRFASMEWLITMINRNRRIWARGSFLSIQSNVVAINQLEYVHHPDCSFGYAHEPSLLQPGPNNIVISWMPYECSSTVRI